MSISEEVSNSEGMSNSDTKIHNVEVEITPLCIRYQRVGNSDWKPDIGQFMWYKIGWFPTVVTSSDIWSINPPQPSPYFSGKCWAPAQVHAGVNISVWRTLLEGQFLCWNPWWSLSYTGPTTKDYQLPSTRINTGLSSAIHTNLRYVRSNEARQAKNWAAVHRTPTTCRRYKQLHEYTYIAVINLLAHI